MPQTVPTRATLSTTWTYFEGEWHEGNVAIMGPRTHGAWMSSVVFDGARAFEGVTPDLDLHLARVNDSARRFHLKPLVSVSEWRALTHEGLSRFDVDEAVYIRPMYWADSGYAGGVKFDPDSTRWCLCLYGAPMPQPGADNAVTLSPYRKPSIDYAPVDAKASCNYPNNARALREASERGFNNALMRDGLGDIAELANANVFLVKDGVVMTPAANGTFLNGVTRQRIIALLRGTGLSVVERTLRHEDFLAADEIFSAGNFAKVAAVTRTEDRALPTGPVFWRARELYWDFAHGRGIKVTAMRRAS